MNFNLLFLKKCIDLSNSPSPINAYLNTISNGNFTLNECIFTRFTPYELKGGVLSFSTGSINFNLTNLIFFSCSSIQEGGAIYISCGTDGQAFFFRICADTCSTTGINGYNGQFANILLSNSKWNSLNEISIQKSAQSMNSKQYYSLYNQGGMQNISNCNISNNICQTGSAICFTGGQKLYGVFLNINNNNSTSGCCYFTNFARYTTLKIYDSNFIKNICNLNEYIFAQADTYNSYGFISCIFMYNFDILFRKLTLYGNFYGTNSYVYHTGVLDYFHHAGYTAIDKSQMTIASEATNTYDLFKIDEIICQKIKGNTICNNYYTCDFFKKIYINILSLMSFVIIFN